jgi:thiamine biosynthesis lipoprotein
VIRGVTELPGIRRVEEIMGMPVILDVRDPVDEAQLDEVYDWFRWVDATFSTYKADSEISRVNRAELHLRDCHADVRWVIARCRELRDETGGYFDAEAVVEGEIDPSGLVKGWSVDRAAAILDEAGFRNYTVNAGGDMRLRGDALPERRWRVGIQHPRVRDRVAAIVEGTDLAVATSGAYTRGEHVIDPHTGRPPTGVLSVTIVGPDLATADAYATAAFAMGEAGPQWTRRLSPYEAMTILANDKTFSTPGFPARRAETALT